MTLGTRIQELREVNSLSRRTLASLREVSYSSTFKYEMMKDSLNKDVLFAFADFFNISLDYMLGRNLIKSDNYIKIAINSISKKD